MSSHFKTIRWNEIKQLVKFLVKYDKKGTKNVYRFWKLRMCKEKTYENLLWLKDYGMIRIPFDTSSKWNVDDNVCNNMKFLFYLTTPVGPWLLHRLFILLCLFYFDVPTFMVVPFYFVCTSCKVFILCNCLIVLQQWFFSHIYSVISNTVNNVLQKQMLRILHLNTWVLSENGSGSHTYHHTYMWLIVLDLFPFNVDLTFRDDQEKGVRSL